MEEFKGAIFDLNESTCDLIKERNNCYMLRNKVIYSIVFYINSNL